MPQNLINENLNKKINQKFGVFNVLIPFRF